MGKKTFFENLCTDNNENNMNDVYALIVILMVLCISLIGYGIHYYAEDSEDTDDEFDFDEFDLDIENNNNSTRNSWLNDDGASSYTHNGKYFTITGKRIPIFYRMQEGTQFKDIQTSTSSDVTSCIYQCDSEDSCIGFYIEPIPYNSSRMKCRFSHIPQAHACYQQGPTANCDSKLIFDQSVSGSVDTADFWINDVISDAVNTDTYVKDGYQWKKDGKIIGTVDSRFGTGGNARVVDFEYTPSDFENTNTGVHT